MDNDQFGFIVKQCLPNSFQQEKLRTCPFAREFENFPDAECSDMDETPEELTPIIMVSLPETSNEDNTFQEDEVFQTASEHSQSHLASSQEQGLIAVDDRHADQEVNRVRDEDDVVLTDAQMETEMEIDVNLGKESDNLAFTGLKSAHEIESGGDDGPKLPPEMNGVRDENDVVMIAGCEDTEMETEIDVDLGKKCDSFVFRGQKSPPKITCGVGQCELKKIEGFRVESSRLKSRVSEEDHELGFKEKVLVGGLNDNKVNDVIPTQGVCENDRKKIEDLDKFRYVHSGSVDQCADKKHAGKKCELQFLTTNKGENVGGSYIGSSVKNGVLSDIFQVLQRVVTDLDNGDGDSDFLAAAKRRGMTFPRPRWWPPEGFDD